MGSPFFQHGWRTTPSSLWWTQAEPWLVERQTIGSISLPLNLDQNRAHHFHAMLSEKADCESDCAKPADPELTTDCLRATSGASPDLLLRPLESVRDPGASREHRDLRRQSPWVGGKSVRHAKWQGIRRAIWGTVRRPEGQYKNKRTKMRIRLIGAAGGCPFYYAWNGARRAYSCLHTSHVARC